jgi:NAD(P)-dependent dehydrogenase (short-subunit alcohol dehydrogenase family)
MKNPMELTGRTILVTGASSGIGRCTAVLLSELGARVVLVARTESKLREAAGLLEGAGHRIEPFDLSNLEAIPDWISDVVKKTGPLSGLVHSAGIAPLSPLRTMTLNNLNEVMRINFQAAVWLTQAFSRRQSHGPESSIVLVSSVAGLCGTPARSAYSASKGALLSFARSAALELVKTGIRVNCVAPALVQTDIYDVSANALSPEQMETLVRTTQPLGLGTPLDVAHAIAFLLAGSSRWITGSVMAVDGGYTAQ